MYNTLKENNVYIGVHFVMFLDSAALSDRKPACAENLQTFEAGLWKKVSWT